MSIQNFSFVLIICMKSSKLECRYSFVHLRWSAMASASSSIAMHGANQHKSKTRRKPKYHFDDPGARHTRQAIRFDRAGDTANALRSFEAAVLYEESKLRGERQTNLGVCLMRLGRLAEAEKAMREAIANKPVRISVLLLKL
eukprot:SAG11_NODE_54_length_19571_cov_29.437786_15_plen_142_part_00